ncbi:MAG TPA: hypothetical protein VIL86_08615 [Tepidisphaeraceae bacterium]|jgi:hypothetical protein
MLAKSVDASGIGRAEALIHRGNEALLDVIAWLTKQEAQRKKEATGG